MTKISSKTISHIQKKISHSMFGTSLDLQYPIFQT